MRLIISFIYCLFFFIGTVFSLQSCAQNTANPTMLPNDNLKTTDTFAVNKSESEWKEQLSPEQYYVLREKGTERSFTGKLLMNKAAGNLLGTHDFTSIEKKGSNNKNAICTIFEAYFFEDENGIVFRITANRFLRNMVRACTSTMLMIGTGQLTINEFLSYFEKKISCI